MRAMSPSAPIGGFRALALGMGALRRNRAVLAFAMVAEGALAACRATLFFAGIAAVAGRFVGGLASSDGGVGGALDSALASSLGADLWLPVVGAYLVLELLGAALRAVGQSAMVVNASGTLVEPPRPPLPVVVAASMVLPRAVVASLWIGVLDVGVGLMRAVVLASSLIVVSHAFASHHGGLGASLVGALGVALASMAALLLALFTRAYRVVALRRLELSAHAAMGDATALVASRLSTLLLLEILSVALVIGGALVAAGPGGLAAALGTRHVALGLVLRVLAAVVAAAWSAGVDLALLGAVCAVDLDQRGELPRPPAPVVAESVLIAEPVLIAQAIDPEPTPGS
jgi:hypothetical protein